MEAINFTNVYLTYDETEALKDFCLSVAPGEFITVVGSSGSGKTTALKLINGLLKCSRGSVTVFGKNVGLMTQKEIIKFRRNIGYVIQGIGLFPHMTVLKNLTYVLDLEKNDKKASLARAKELINLVDMDEEILFRHPRELSGGQRQRVGIARALAANPQILLMDEPFGAVDEITRKGLQKAISEIHKKLKPTIFFITHDIDEALMLGDRVLVLQNGVINQCDRPEELLRNPATEFVSGLLGHRYSK